jgi:hypothetical protein
MRSPLDRRVAVVALAAATVAMAVPIATVRAPLPHVADNEGRRAEARRELLVLARRAERATFLVDFAFERRLAGGPRLTEVSTEANRPPLHIVSSGATVTVDFGRRIVTCTETDKGPSCLERADDPALALSAVYREVTRLGAYAVERIDDRTIARERARCFRLVAARAALPQLGQYTEQCYAADGVPLRSVVKRTASLDARVAQQVKRDVTTAELSALLDRLDQEAGTGGR